MSTTLTNGLKLPDKGSVDWYADMQNNYAILDGAVGTVAEHSTQIAGKAPAVHTHTKADITDLFNSANTWSGLNSYNQSIQITANFNIGVAPSSDVYGGFTFGNGNANIGNVTARVSSAGITYSRLYVSNKYANGALDPNGTLTNVELQVGLKANGNRFIYTNAFWSNSLTPDTNNTYDLGSSSYQWNNAYIKSLTINGVACGDILTHNASEFVDVSSNQTIGGRKNFNIVSASDAVISKKYLNFNDNTFIYISGGNGWNLGGQINLVRKGDITTDDSGNIVTDGGDVTLRCANNLCGIFDVVLNVNNSIREPQFSPTHNKINLGTSTNKWKSFNGVNPGALSLPDTLGTSGTENVNYFNVIGYLNNTGTLATIPSTATYDGWLYINAKDGADSYIIIDDSPSSFGTSVFGNNGLGAQGIGLLCLMCPIRKGHAYNVRIKSAGIVSARIYPAQGNV